MTPLRRPPALRRATALLVLASLLVLLSGCGFRGAYSLTLPGGADVGSHPYTLNIEFADVLDLVPQSAVKVDNVPVGRVTKIALGPHWTALVTVVVSEKASLPANVLASIQQSSLLGEKYVSLSSPPSPSGTLKSGDTITLDRTGRSVEVEELLGALSLVLNGGGLANLQTINKELADALQGRESALRSTLQELTTFVGGLDAQKGEITRALQSVDALAASLATHTPTIEHALDTIGPGLDVLTSQRSLLVTMLHSLARLGDVGTRIINQAGADTVADLKSLQPILQSLAAAGPNLANSLDLLLTYPFPASSLTALNYRPDASTGGYGLYTNMTASLSLDFSRTLCSLVVDPTTGALKSLPTPPPACSTSPTSPTPSSSAPPPALPTLPTLPSLKGTPLSSLPSTPTLPGLPLVGGAP